MGGYGEAAVTARPAIDWGAPRPAEWPGPRETLNARVPVELVQALRRAARTEGVSLNTLVHRLLVKALQAEQDERLARHYEPDVVGF
jgi:hypothetical protein